MTVVPKASKVGYAAFRLHGVEAQAALFELVLVDLS